MACAVLDCLFDFEIVFDYVLLWLVRICDLFYIAFEFVRFCLFGVIVLWLIYLVVFICLLQVSLVLVFDFVVVLFGCFNLGL